jgi:hypothetical protein
MTTQALIRRIAAPALAPPSAWWQHRTATRRDGGQQRDRLAARLERIVEEAHEPPAGLATAIPVQRDEVRATEPLLLELAARLREPGAASTAGLANTKRLLTDGTGPLFAPCASGALRDAVAGAILALDDARAQTT